MLSLNGQTAHAAQSDQASTTEITAIATATTTAASNTAIHVPNSEEPSATAPKTGAQEVFSSNATTVPSVRALNTPARVTGFRDTTTQTVSTQTDKNELQCTTKFFATTARLYGTFPGKGSPTRFPFLEKTKHNAVATHYLRTVGGCDLPSFPTKGLLHPEAAGAAALLAHRSHRPVEIWRPDSISAAGAAASLAHTNPKYLGVWEPTPSKPAGKAALHAFQDSSFPQQYTMPESYEHWSLTGAIRAIRNSKERWRSESSPVPLTIRQETGAASAGNSTLTATTITHMPPVIVDPTSEGVAESKALDAGRVPQQDKRRSDILRAATVSMSKSNRDTTLLSNISRQNYLVQADLQRLAATPPPRQNSSNNRPPPAFLLGTQGAQGGQASVNRSYSVTSAGSSDIGRAWKVDSEMALLRNNLTRVDDARKRGENAVSLMPAAQRNVQARMSAIDKQVAESRGVVRREDWDAKAILIAQAGSNKRIKHQGKISIGGGAYMAPEEIDAIAGKNVQPVLDDINRRADAERTKIETERVRDLEVQRAQDLQRTRERERRGDIKKARVIEEGKRATKERKQLVKIDSERGRESRGASDVEALRSPVSSMSLVSDGSSRERGIRGLINRFRKRRSRQISHDEKNVIVASTQTEGGTAVPTFSGGHRAALAEQQRATEANDSQVGASGGPRSIPASKIPRPVSTAVVPQTNGTIRVSKALASPRAVRSVSVAGVLPIVTNGNEETPVKRRHSLSSIGTTGHHFKGRKRANDAALASSWTEDQGIKKGKGRILAKKTRDFAKINGRISSTKDHSEYPDEARDTFSQQSTSFVPLNRPPPGPLPHDERRFSAGETSISSRFREDL